jgi:hypothetical protein
MHMTYNPETALKGRPDMYDPFASFNAWKFDAAMPDNWRSMAKNSVDQTRQAYEHAKSTLDAGVLAMERSCDAASQAALALNRKIVDIAARNIDSSFDLARSLTAAKNFAEVVELQGAYWRKQLNILLAQAEEVRTLSVEAGEEMAEPIAKQARSGMEQAQEFARKAADAAAAAANGSLRQAAKQEEAFRRTG